MSDSDYTAKLIKQLEADYFSDNSTSAPVARRDSNINKAAREVREVIQEYQVEPEQINKLLMSPEQISIYQEFPLEMVDRVFELTEELDPFEIQKLTLLLK